MIELLAPAGDFESLKAAIAAGANAVYISGKSYGARSFAGNFDDSELVEAVKYAHLRNVKIYVTVNTLVKNDELESAYDYINFLYNSDVDAVIVQDLGVLNILNKYFPDFEKHASTQMAIYNTIGFDFLKKHGFSRGVIAREASISDIKTIRENSDLEIEAFIHGALCYSYSGLCLMSSMIGGRSGNRGKCAQPCRKLYSFGEENEKESYLISPKDLNTFDEVEKIIASGVSSLKIEGRMRSPEYVFTVVKAYREMIDNKDSSSKSQIEKAFNREFTKGYILDEKPSEVTNISNSSNQGVFIGTANKTSKFKISIKLEEQLLVGDKLKLIGKNSEKGIEVFNIYRNDRKISMGEPGDLVEIDYKGDLENDVIVNRTYDISLKESMLEKIKEDNLVPIDLSFEIKVGKQPKLCVETHEMRIELSGEDLVEKSINTVQTEEKLFKSINKFGDTPYYIKNYELIFDENAYIPQKSINKLRRDVIELMLDKSSNFNNRIYKENEYDSILVDDIREKKEFKYYAMTYDQLIALETSNVRECYFVDYMNTEKIKSVYSGVVNPWVMPIHNDVEVNEDFCISNPGDLIQSIDTVDTFFNIMNNEAIDFLEKEYNVQSINLSMELNQNELKEMFAVRSELGYICYGYPVVMISKGCPKKSTGLYNCTDCELNYLLDEKDEKFFYKCISGKTYFFNGKPILIKPSSLNRIVNLKNLNVYFTIETQSETELIIRSLSQNEGADIMEITAGHYNRGVM